MSGADLDAAAEENALRRVTQLLVQERAENARLREALAKANADLAEAYNAIGEARARTQHLVRTLEAAAVAAAEEEGIVS